jgi:hypothetical protein
MKKTRTANELSAATAARKRGLLMGGFGVLIGLIMNFLTTDFLSLHCALMLGVALAGGLAAALSALPIDSGSAISSGSVGGIYAGLGFSIPFIAMNLYRWATTDATNVGARIAKLSQTELDNIIQAKIQLGEEYFRFQDISYVFGYLLAALFMGWIFGMLGGALAKRRMTRV